VRKYAFSYIPEGNSKEYNADKFAKPKRKQHFTDEYINDKNTCKISAVKK